MKQWYRAKVKHTRLNDEGVEKRGISEFLIEAFSYTDAETIINRLISDGEIESTGEFSISEISKSNISDVPFHYQDQIGVVAQQEALLDDTSENEFDDDLNWRVKTEHETLLINAVTARDAADKVNDLYADTGMQPDIVSISKTKIVNVFRNESVEAE